MPSFIAVLGPHSYPRNDPTPVIRWHTRCIDDCDEAALSD